MTRTLDDIVPGEAVTFLNPEPFSNITGIVIADPEWSGGWRVNGLSKTALANLGFTVLEVPCGHVSDGGRVCIQEPEHQSWWHFDAIESWKSDRFDSAVPDDVAPGGAS